MSQWKWGCHVVSESFEDRIRVQRVSVGRTVMAHCPVSYCTDRETEAWTEREHCST